MKLKVNSCDGIYNNCLDVRFTKSCDNNCAFCIEKNGIDSQGNTEVHKMIDNTVKSQKEIVLILGGEPFLLPDKLLAYIKGIRNFVKKIYITTSLPKTIDDSDRIIEIFKLIDGLNVSLQHYDWKINNDVLNAKSKHNRLDILRKILSIPFMQNKVRVSINLVSGYIDNKEKLLNCLSTLKSIKCKQVKINELQKVDKNIFISFEKIMNVKMKSPYSNGCQTDISNLFKALDMKIILKRSCFVVQDQLIAKATISDLIKSIIKYFIKPINNMCVMYENGFVSEGWITK